MGIFDNIFKGKHKKKEEFVYELNDLPIKQLWQTFLTEVDEIMPEFSKSFNSPSNEKEIKQFEEKMELELPQELKDLYLCNNGGKESVFNATFCFKTSSLECMYRDWKISKDLLNNLKKDELQEYSKYCSSSPEGAIKRVILNDKWIPLASDGGGNFLGLDLDPDSNGKLGQIINFGRDEDKKYIIAKSLKDYLILLITHIRESKVEVVIQEDKKYLKYKEYWHPFDLYKQEFGNKS